jgi:nucleoid-associated protein YgaU
MMRAANPNPTGNSMSQSAPNPTPNTNAQAAAQAAQAALQAAKAKTQAATAAAENAEIEEPASTENDEQLAKAWGFTSKRPRLSKEAVIGLVAIIALLVMFSYVVARHFQNRAQVAEKPSKEDPELKPASNDELMTNSPSNVTEELDALENNAPKKSSTAKLDLDEDLLDIGAGQTEPGPPKVATKKQSLPIDLDDQFDTFGDDAQTTRPKPAPKKTETVMDDAPEFGNDEPSPKTNRSTVSLDLDEPAESTEPELPALTKTTEPIQLKQPVQTVPADEEFEKPVRKTPAQQIEDEFEVVPQRARRPVQVAQQDRFTEKAAFDDRRTQPSPTTELPPARTRTTAKPSSRHPLLNEGEYLVEEGDNFCVISKKLYGSEKYFLALAEHNRNRVADPCRMRPGLVIAAPAKEVLEQQHSSLIAKPKLTAEAKDAKPHSTKKVSAAPLPPGMFHDANGVPWYRVGENDNLTKIAQAHLGRASRADQIFNLNRERLPNRNDLRPGQELRLPNDAIQVRIVEGEKSLR